MACCQSPAGQQPLESALSPCVKLATVVATIADPGRRALRQSVPNHGVAAPEIKPVHGSYIRLLDEMQAQFLETAFLAGATFSTADATVVLFLTRIDHLGMGELIAARPKAKAWLDKVDARQAFKRMVADVLPKAVTETFRANGSRAWPMPPALTR
jgi:glutathione S-transferase